MKHTPKLGQHFLTRPEIAGCVADVLHLKKSDVVLEIGPGHGILTRELLKKVGKVIAIEKDNTLVAELKTTFAEEIKRGQLTLLESDVRDFKPETCEFLQDEYYLVANIPYYITGAIMRQFLTSQHQPKGLSVLMQKEVAERIVARDKKQSLLSLSVHVFGSPKLEKVVKAGAFSPPPKVDSAILSVQNISRENLENKEREDAFFELIHTAFSQKRKTLGATLKGKVTDEQFIKCSLNKKARPEDVPLSQWLCLLG